MVRYCTTTLLMTRSGEPALVSVSPLITPDTSVMQSESSGAETVEDSSAQVNRSDPAGRLPDLYPDRIRWLVPPLVPNIPEE